MYQVKGYDEGQVLEVIEKVVGILSNKFRFGYYSIDDLKQEGRLFCLEALSRFDPNKGFTLDNFLYRHVRNRFINFKRDNYKRNESPCLKCPFFDKKFKNSKNQCTAFDEKLDCELWALFVSKNKSKSQLVEVGVAHNDISNTQLRTGKLNDIEETFDIVAFAELKKKIDDKLPLNLRGFYLRMLAGAPVSKINRDKVKNAVINILND